MRSILPSFLITALVLTSACAGTPADPLSPATPAIASPARPEIRDIPASYDRLKADIRKEQAAFRQQGAQTGAIPAARQYLFRMIHDSLFYYWYGTAWDFNGITEVPNGGKIACGYFVTTVLRDAGFPIARIRLAQAPASILIRAVCAPATIRQYSLLEDLETYLNALPDSSLLILGLDNHVGFACRTGGRNYFIHASYMGAQAVIKELLTDSAPIRQSGTYMIGNALANDALIRRWMGNEGIGN